MYKNGLLFEEEYVKELKKEFFMVDSDPEIGERLFFDNSGGSLRLKSCVLAKSETEAYPDCPERVHERATVLKKMVTDGTELLLKTVFGAKEGSVMTELTASQTMFQMVGIIMENIPGKNAVVSSLEHPSAFDAVEYYCKKLGRELRVIPANIVTGGIDPEAAADVFHFANDQIADLVSAGALAQIGGSYRTAVEEGYRFFSFGDAMFIC